MKKLLVVLLAVAMIFAFAACAQEPNQPDTSATDTEETDVTYTVGMLTMNNLTEEQAFEIAEYFSGYEAGPGFHVIFYNDISTAVLALKSGEIDQLSRLPKCTAEYIAARNDGMEIKDTMSRDDAACYNKYAMAVMEENAALGDELSVAIKAMQDDGTLEQLIADYLTAYVAAGDDPAAVEMPVIEGADTVKVAITGCLPPLDFIAANGTPAGFNVAFLAELSNRIGKNIELVTVDSGSRSIALASGKVDAVFWNAVCDVTDDIDAELTGGTKLSQIDVPEGVVLTDFYFTDARATLLMK